MTGKQVQAKGSRVDLTLQSIHGIVSETNPYDVTAAVSFTGSASNMQVSSFTMCGRTGNLVVESNALEVEDSNVTNDASEQVESKPSRIPLFATFNEPLAGRRSLPSCAMSAASNSSSHRPHLKLKLSESNPNIPKRSLATVNQNSVVQQNPPVVDDGQSMVSVDGSRGASIHWEAEGDAMPDIVELHITLRNGDHSIVCQEGIAHLVFYRSKQELGLTTMDLRIKKKPPMNPNAPADPAVNNSVSFAEDAYIRVQVEVTSDDDPVPSPEEIILSDNIDEHKIGNIMIKLKEHEEMAAARAKAHKMTFDKHDDLGKNAPRRVFCNGGLDFGETFRVIVDALTKCDGKKRRKGNTKSFIPILRASSTMDSTIETRESMLL